MPSDYKIRDKKAQCNINKKSPIIWALTSDKFNEYEYLTKEEILFTRESDRRSWILIISSGKRNWKTNKNNWK